ncbi:MAG: L-rhamnose mutarotase [Oscillospiraceae bacterium]
MQRIGQIIQIKPEHLKTYKALHASPWPEINAKIKECGISNYSIYQREGYLFSYFEYIGADYEADMQKMADDPTTQAWWALCKPCQQPLSSIVEGEWWADMEEVYHLD